MLMMQKLYSLLIGVFSLLLFTVFAKSQSVLNPADAIVEYNSSNPPVQPQTGQIGKWVRTKRLNWNTDSYKAYIYKGFAFRLKFPKTYDPTAKDGKKYPVLIFFHGLGETGPITDNEYQLYHGGQEFAAAVDDGVFDGYILCMQSQGSWENSHYTAVKEIIDYMIKNNKVDQFRITDNGLSAGGEGTWKFMLKYPNLIAASLPMSAVNTTYKSSSNIKKIKYTPLWNFQGGKDINPNPLTARKVRDAMLEAGGNYKYTEYTDLGHGTWDRAWSEPDFFPFVVRAYKSNPWPLTGRTEFCPEDEINVTIGLTPGFTAYQWQRNGMIINGADSNTIVVKDTGTYSARVKRSSTWSDWSPIPVQIKYKEATVTPPITIAGQMSNVIPSADNKNYVNLQVPDNGYIGYTWKRNDNDSIVGTQRVLKVTQPGDYIVSVKELYGCSSIFSQAFTVVDANGINKPDPATNLVAYVLSNTQIELDWSNNPKPAFNEKAFEIYRAKANSPYQYIGKTDADILTFVDSTVVPNATYSYKIRAVNSTGASVVSNIVTISAEVDKVPPSPPVNLHVTGTTNSSISLQWEAPSTDIGIDKYLVYINGTLSYSTTQTSFTINSLQPLQQYSIYVIAKDVAGNSSNPSNQVSAPSVLQGLQYKYYEGNWSVLPDFNTLTPFKTGTSKNIDISIRNREDQFAVLWQGYIKIPVTGTYKFETYSDDGSKLWLGTYDASATPLVNNDGLHGSQFNSGTVTLQAGIYPISVAYFEQQGDQVMQLYWTSVEAFGSNSRRQIDDQYFGGNYTPSGTAPATPVLTSVAAESYNKINLSWTDNSNDETGFEIYRSISKDGPFNIIATVNDNQTSFTDTTLNPSTTYYYRIQAINQFGSSNFESITKNSVVTGLKYAYYEGLWNKLPDFNTLTPVKTGVVNNITLSPAISRTNYAFRFEGMINITSSGYYTFYIASDDGSKLYIGGFSEDKVVVNNDFLQGVTERSGTVYLNKGTYPFYITYFQQGGDAVLTVSYSDESGNKTNIPDAMLTANALADANYATTFDIPAAPLSPSNLIATAISSSAITLSWEDVATNELNYEVYRSTGNTNKFRLITTLPANSTGYKDSILFSNIEYYYKIKVNGVAETAATSNVVSAKTQNNVPQITKLNDRSARYGTTTTITVNAIDTDGEDLSFNIANNPSFVTLTDNKDKTATIVINPSISDANVYNNITITVKDGNGGSDVTSFNLTVNDNYEPQINNIPDYTVDENSDLNIPLNATDLNNADVINWSVSGLPFASAVTANSNTSATLSLKPNYTSAGKYVVTVSANDGKGGTSSQQFFLTVNDKEYNSQIYVRFKNSASEGSPWNDIIGKTTKNLLDADGKKTSVGLSLQTNWWATLNEGPTTGNNSGVYPDAVLNEYYYFGTAGGPRKVSDKITGLKASGLYKLTFYAGSSWSGATNNGTTTFTVNGQMVSLAVQDNTQNTVSIENIKPKSDGSVTFSMAKGANTKAGFINALVISQTIDDGTLPIAPSDLLVKNTTIQGTALSWKDISYNEFGYEVFRSDSETGTFTKIGEIPPNTSSYIDSSVMGFTTYYYKIRAFNNIGASDYSNIAHITTVNKIPKINPLENVVLKNNESISVNVTSTDDSNDKIRLTATNLPDFASFTDNGNGTGTISIKPFVNSIGFYHNIMVTATDNSDSSRSTSFDLSVTDKNITSVYINFTNTDLAPTPWNNFAGKPSANKKLTKLIDDSNNTTGISVTLLDAFKSVVSIGMNPGNGKGIYSETVMRSGENETSANTKRIQVSGLDPSKKYNFVFFNSRDNGVSSLTNFTINGQTVSLEASYNLEKTVQINNVIPTADGQVIINVAKDSKAVSAMINAMIIQIINTSVSPSSPADLKVTNVSRSAASLIWADRSSDETGYEVWRATESGSYSKIATLNANATSYNDANLNPNTTFYYTVRAVKNGTYSDYSNVAKATTYAYAVYVNFTNSNIASAPWNNTETPPQANYMWHNFFNESSAPTGLGMQQLTDFAGLYSAGMNTGNNSGIVPDKVMTDSYGLFPGQSASIKITGLNLSMAYNFTFFASSNIKGDLTTSYTINNKTVFLNTSLNTNGTVSMYDVIPDENGEAIITIAPGTATSELGLIGGLIIQAFTPSIAITPQPTNITQTKNTQITNARLTNLDESITGAKISAFPNPFIEHFTLLIPASVKQKVLIKVYDMSGKLLYQKEAEIEKGDNLIKIQASQKLSTSGVYLVNVYYEQEHIIKTLKLVKTK